MLAEDQFKARLFANGLARPETLLGCTDFEITSIEASCACVLPESYKCFLRLCGKKAGLLFFDIAAFFPSLLSLTEEARDLLAEIEDNVMLPESAFVFANRHGLQFLFFGTDDGNEPPVFRYCEGHGRFERIAESFWQIVEEELAQLENFKLTDPNNPWWAHATTY